MYLCIQFHSKRTFKPHDGRHAEHKHHHKKVNPALYQHAYPHMEKDQLRRIMRIPGVRKFMGKQIIRGVPAIPWYFLGKDRHAALHIANPLKHELAAEIEGESWADELLAEEEGNPLDATALAEHLNKLKAHILKYI